MECSTLVDEDGHLVDAANDGDKSIYVERSEADKAKYDAGGDQRKSIDRIGETEDPSAFVGWAPGLDIFSNKGIEIISNSGGGYLINSNGSMLNIPSSKYSGPWWYSAVSIFSSTFTGIEILGRSCSTKVPFLGKIGFWISIFKSSDEIRSDPMKGNDEVKDKAAMDIISNFVGSYLGNMGFIGGLNYQIIDEIVGIKEYQKGFMNSVSLYGKYNNPMFIRNLTH